MGEAFVDIGKPTKVGICETLRVTLLRLYFRNLAGAGTFSPESGFNCGECGALSVWECARISEWRLVWRISDSKSVNTSDSSHLFYVLDPVPRSERE